MTTTTCRVHKTFPLILELSMNILANFNMFCYKILLLGKSNRMRCLVTGSTAAQEFGLQHKN